MSWCVTGDFNDIMYTEEKQGWKEQPRALMNGFKEAINACELIDLGFIAHKSTLEKSRGSENWVQERLDKGLANHEWHNMFMHTEVKEIEVSTSDNLPLHLQLNKHVYVPKGRDFVLRIFEFVKKIV